MRIDSPTLGSKQAPIAHCRCGFAAVPDFRVSIENGKLAVFGVY